MKVMMSFLLLIAISACSTLKVISDTSLNTSLPDLGAAPELESDTWINVDNPIKLVDLKGKVILLDMWTYG
jgi:hypothetical protein